MIDKDGIQRPDNTSEHMKPLKVGKRHVKFDEHYNYRIRNPFYRFWTAIFRQIAITLINPWMVLTNRIKIYNKKHIKKVRGKAFVCVVNHVDYVDDLCTGTNVFYWRKVYFTTLKENIKRRVVGFFLRTLGGIPIPTDSVNGMRKFEEDCSYLLSHKKPIIYNPEGSLWPKYRGLRPFKRGAFVAAVKNDVPVFPIAITFKRKKKKNGKYKYKLFYNLCEPIYIDHTLETEKEKSEKLLRQTFEVMDKTIKEFYQNNDCGFDDEKEQEA